MAIKFKEAFNLYFLNIEQLRGIGEHLKLGLVKHNSFFHQWKNLKGVWIKFLNTFLCF